MFVEDPANAHLLDQEDTRKRTREEPHSGQSTKRAKTQSEQDEVS